MPKTAFALAAAIGVATLSSVNADVSCPLNYNAVTITAVNSDGCQSHLYWEYYDGVNHPVLYQDEIAQAACNNLNLRSTDSKNTNQIIHDDEWAVIGGDEPEACPPPPTQAPTPSPTAPANYLCHGNPGAGGWLEYQWLATEAGCQWFKDWVADGTSPYTPLGNFGILGMCAQAPSLNTFGQTVTETAINYEDFFQLGLQDPDYDPSCSDHDDRRMLREGETDEARELRQAKSRKAFIAMAKAARKEAKARGLPFGQEKKAVNKSERTLEGLERYLNAHGVSA
ncbi:MAG: hypothetical protein ACTSUE_07575 [Promethearchaeota archaeon]